jgi:hypothetical protein
MPHPDHPLTLRDPALLEQPRGATWSERLPVIGYLLWWQHLCRRFEQAKAEVADLLRERSAFPAEAWREVDVDPVFAESVAQSISHMVVRKHPNHFYLPDDPLKLLLADVEGMAFVEASHILQQTFSCRIDPQRLLPWEAARFVELVRLVPQPVRRG